MRLDFIMIRVTGMTPGNLNLRDTSIRMEKLYHQIIQIEEGDTKILGFLDTSWCRDSIYHRFEEKNPKIQKMNSVSNNLHLT